MKCITLRNLVVALLVAVMALATCSASVAQEKKPNVVMLMSDDVGWSDYGCLRRSTSAIRRRTLTAWPRKE